MIRAAVLSLALLCVGCGGGPRLTVEALTATPEAGGFTVSWRLSRPGFARMDYWMIAQPDARKNGQARLLPGVDYRVAVTGLAPDTSYAYEVVAGPDAALLDDTLRTPPATVRTPPQISIFDVLVTVDGTQAKVTWRTNRPTDSSVAYGRTEELEARKSNPAQSAATAHTVTLTGLAAGQAYQLKVVATDASGQAPVTHGPQSSFTTPASASGIARIMPRQGPRTNTLVDLSRDYLKRLKSLSAKEKTALEKEIQAQAPQEQIELSPEERAELTAHPTDPADAPSFERRVDLVQRWIIHLGQQGKDVEPLSRTAVTLSNRYFVAPPQAASELDKTVRTLLDMDPH